MFNGETPILADLLAPIASCFAALAEPNRVRVLDALRRHGELSVTEVAEQVGLGYASVARHHAELELSAGHPSASVATDAHEGKTR